MSIDYPLHTFASLYAQTRAENRRYDVEPPLVRLWDKNHEFLCECTELYDLRFDHKVNAAGGLDMTLPADSVAAEMLRDESHEAVTRITVDLPDGYRWHGAITDVEVVWDEERTEVLVKALHSYHHLETMLFWANPLFPAQLQPLAADVRIGPARTVLASYLVLNLARLQLPLWMIPTNIDFFDIETYNLFKRAMWPIAVKPVNPITDTSRWVAATPCFQSAGEIIDQLAGNDSGLCVEVNLWLPGDEQPWLTANFTKPTMWIDIVDNGIERNFTGTLIDGLIKVAVDLLDDAAGFILYPVLGEDSLGDDGQGLISGALKIEDRSSIPVYRAVDTPESGVKKHEMVKHKPLASQVVVGGKSPEFVNKAIDVGMEALAQGIMTALQGAAGAAGGVVAGASIPGIGPIPGAGALVGPAVGMVGGLDLSPAAGLAASMMHDKLFAFLAWENLGQATRSGPYRFREVAHLGGSGLGLMTYQNVVNATYSQRPYVTHRVEVENGRPYRIHVDFKPGQLVGIDKPGEYTKDGHPIIHVARVTECTYTYDRAHANNWEIQLGDPSADKEPGQRSLERIRKISQIINMAATNQTNI